MISASVSDICAFRRYLEDEDFDLGVLVAQLRKQTEPTELMRAGSAFHKALELAPAGEFDTLEADGFTFALKCDAELPLSPIRELSVTKDYPAGEHVVHVRGRVDEINGTEIVDHKTTGRFDPETLSDGYQWRFYLDMLNGASFRWNVFELRASTTTPGLYTVSDVHPLTQYPYPGMQEDILKLVRRFAAFCVTYLPERIVVWGDC